MAISSALADQINRLLRGRPPNPNQKTLNQAIDYINARPELRRIVEGGAPTGLSSQNLEAYRQSEAQRLGINPSSSQQIPGQISGKTPIEIQLGQSLINPNQPVTIQRKYPQSIQTIFAQRQQSLTVPNTSNNVGLLRIPGLVKEPQSRPATNINFSGGDQQYFQVKNVPVTPPVRDIVLGPSRDILGVVRKFSKKLAEREVEKLKESDFEGEIIRIANPSNKLGLLKIKGLVKEPKSYPGLTINITPENVGKAVETTGEIAPFFTPLGPAYAVATGPAYAEEGILTATAPGATTTQKVLGGAQTILGATATVYGASELWGKIFGESEGGAEGLLKLNKKDLGKIKEFEEVPESKIVNLLKEVKENPGSVDFTVPKIGTREIEGDLFIEASLKKKGSDVVREFIPTGREVGVIKETRIIKGKRVTFEGTAERTAQGYYKETIDYGAGLRKVINLNENTGRGVVEYYKQGELVYRSQQANIRNLAEIKLSKPKISKVKINEQLSLQGYSIERFKVGNKFNYKISGPNGEYVVTDKLPNLNAKKFVGEFKEILRKGQNIEEGIFVVSRSGSGFLDITEAGARKGLVGGSDVLGPRQFGKQVGQRIEEGNHLESDTNLFFRKGKEVREAKTVSPIINRESTSFSGGETTTLFVNPTSEFLNPLREEQRFRDFVDLALANELKVSNAKIKFLEKSEEVRNYVNLNKGRLQQFFKKFRKVKQTGGTTDLYSFQTRQTGGTTTLNSLQDVVYVPKGRMLNIVGEAPRPAPLLLPSGERIVQGSSGGLFSGIIPLVSAANTPTKTQSVNLFSNTIPLVSTSNTPIQTLSVDLFNTQGTSNLNLLSTSPVNLFEQIPISNLDVGQDQPQEQRSEQLTTQQLAQTQLLSLSQQTTQRQQQRQEQRSRLRMREESSMRLKLPTTGRETKSPSAGGIPSLKGWYAEYKDKGKWKKVLKQALPKAQAKALAANVADNSTAVSIRVRDAMKNAKPLKTVPRFPEQKFRNYKISRGKRMALLNQWIEKKSARIDTPGEKQQLSAAKYLKTKGFRNLISLNSKQETAKKKKKTKGRKALRRATLFFR